MIPSARTRVRVCVVLESGTVGQFNRTHVDEDIPLNGHCTYNGSDEKPRDPHPRTNDGAFSIGFDVSEHQVRHANRIIIRLHSQEQPVDTQRPSKSNDYLDCD